MGEDRFEMGQKQRDRLKFLHEVVQGKLKQTEAAEQLKLSTRQVRRLVKKMTKLGDRAVVHGFWGTRVESRDWGENCKPVLNELRKPDGILARPTRRNICTTSSA